MSGRGRGEVISSPTYPAPHQISLLQFVDLTLSHVRVDTTGVSQLLQRSELD